MRKNKGKAISGSINTKDKKYIFLFIAPAILALIVLRIMPVLYSFGISFTGWNLYEPGSSGKFVGLDNYTGFFNDNNFGSAIGVTFKMGILCVLISMLVGTALAFLMYQELKGSQIIRGMIISAMIIAPVVVGTCWRLMYNPGNGLINMLLDLIGIGGQPFLAQQSTAIGAVVAADVWQDSPYVMIIVLAGLQGLPLDIFEAAKIDGASAWQTFRRITLPLIKQSIMLALVVRTMDALKIFDMVYAMTKGGPGTATLNLNILMFLTGFNYYQLGKAAAICMFILILVAIPCGIIVWFFRRNEKAA